MNTNLRALIFGVAVAAALTITLDSVVAAEATQVVRLDTVYVTAHRAAFDAGRDVRPVRLDPVVVIAHRANLG